MMLNPVHILDLINEIGEAEVNAALSDFSCPKNPDVEHFVKHNAIEFTRKGQSVTYLVLDHDTGDIVAYYTLAVKPLSIKAESVSKSLAKRLARVSILDEETQTYTTAAYLIAQLGKNYALPKQEQMNGEALLQLAMTALVDVRYTIGGLIAFLECEDNPFLLDFYEKNSFTVFDARISHSPKGAPHKLYQLLRRID